MLQCIGFTRKSLLKKSFVVFFFPYYVNFFQAEILNKAASQTYNNLKESNLIVELKSYNHAFTLKRTEYNEKPQLLCVKTDYRSKNKDLLI